MNDQNQELTEARINIGRLQTEVAHLTQGMTDLQESNKELTAKLDQVLLALSEAKGGWKVMMLVGGAATTLGGLGTWAIQHWRA